MAHRKGMVLNTHSDGWAEVMVQSDSNCGSCESGCGCSVSAQRPKVATRVLNRAGAQEGDMVDIRMDSGRMFKSFAILYLLPIAGLMVGAVVGAELDNLYSNSPISIAIFLGLAGLGLGFLVSILASRKMSLNSKFSPVITRIIGIREARADYAKSGA
jgi:sigma-E factor negative regulatory protein RseC